jgi:hypothetical protein
LKKGFANTKHRSIEESAMRTCILIGLVALVVAVGTAFAVGFVDMAIDHPEGKCVLTVTVNPSMIRPLPGLTKAAGTDSSESTDQNIIDVTGKITAVRPEKDEFVVSENIKSWTFQLAKRGKVFVNDREAKLGDLKAGDEATVTFERQGPMMIASVVRSTRK